MRHNLIASLFVLLLGSNSTPALAVSIVLPPTGQTTCQDMDGLPIPCAGTRQDGELRKGALLSGLRFAVNSHIDGDSVTDNLTTLVWAKDANLLLNRNPSFDTDGIGDPDGRISTKTALTYIDKLNAESFGGHSDWRLPNRNELMSLIDTERVNPALPTGHPFINVQNSEYGTNSADKNRPVTFTWLVNMKNATVGTGYSDSTFPINFWPVRGGSWSGPGGKTYLPATNQKLCYDYSSFSSSPVSCATTSGQDGNLQKGVVWPEPRFSGFDGGSVRDALTNLVWTSSTDTPGPAACNPGVNRTWQEAFSYIACLNTNAYLGASNWRMPNRNELSSLSYIEGEFPPANHPFDVNNNYFLFHSSTPVAEDNTTAGESESMNAWTVRMDGWVSMQGKLAAYPVWPVRDFQIVLPATGQTTVYAIGDDGSTRKGLTAAPPRFVNLGDTAYDTLTGLTWAKFVNADGPEICVPNEPKDRAGAFAFIDCLNSEIFLGYIDWRLPNRNELMSLVDSEQANPALPAGHPFQEMPAGGASFWTSSRGEFSGYGWYVDFTNGTTGPEVNPTQTHHVWSVRGSSWTGPPAKAYVSATGQTTPDGTGSDGDLRLGVAWPAPRFSDNGNGTVTDNLTALIWSQDTNTPDRTCNLDTTLTWADAMAHVACLNTNSYLGFNDWRLPNRREMASIIDMEQRRPALPTGHPFSNVQINFNYWSSTTAAADSTKAIVIGMGMGSEGLREKSEMLPVWPIRGEGSYLILDTTPPEITAFTLPALSVSANVTITAFTATDNVGVTDYCARTVNDSNGCLWSTSPPTSYNFGSGGAKTLYAFARDAADNISTVATATTTIILPVNGACGPAHAGFFINQPSTGFCSQGNASAVAGIGPWSWSCQGTIGGSTADCSAQMTVAITIPRTGQWSCYAANGTEVDCLATGQDGDIRAGGLWPTQRFTENGDGTIFDALTGLSWTTHANILKARNPGDDTDDTVGDGYVTWQHALDYVKKLNLESYLGFNDWRLPNINELQSLVDSAYSLPALTAGHPFFSIEPVETVHYWSSTSSPANPASALAVGINGNGNILPANKLAAFGVWPVRGNLAIPEMDHSLGKTGQSLCFDTAGTTITCAGTGQDGELRIGVNWPTERFANNGDQTITDLHTSLIWSLDAATPGPAACTPGGGRNWQNALDHVACLNANQYLGFADWRLPNRLELTSLYNRGVANTASWLLDAGFSGVQTSLYWSGTTSIDTPAYAFEAFNFSEYVAKWFKGDPGRVWPVRGGVIIDDVAPVVDFALPVTASSATVAISTFTATDNVGVTGYLLTESATPPAADDPGWSADAPTSYLFSDVTGGIATDKVLYAWAKDAAGNISGGFEATVTITIPDTTAPVVTFTLPATSTSAIVTFNIFSASDNVAVTSYCVREVDNSAGCIWSATAPASYTFTGILENIDTGKTLYAFARDAAGNISGSVTSTVTITIVDAVAPTLTGCNLSISMAITTIPIHNCIASDNIAVTGFCFSELDNPATCNWTATMPTSYTYPDVPDGISTNKLLYAWARDAAGNISSYRSYNITITPPDITPPVVNTFSLPNISTSLTVAIFVFTATDNVAVNGYCVQESNDPANCAWLATPPTGYTFSWTTIGLRPLYAFVKDLTGHISSAATASVNIDPLVRISFPLNYLYFSTVQSAYDSAFTGDVIQPKSGTITNDLLANSEITVTLEGGAYGSSPAGNTVIKGVVRIRAGKIIMKKIAIAPLDAGV